MENGITGQGAVSKNKAGRGPVWAQTKEKM